MSVQQPCSPERLALLRSAVETLLETGTTSYTELSVGAICTETGISRPTFYASFADKTDLIRALAAETITDLIDASSPWLGEPPATWEVLYDEFAEVLEVYAPHRRVMSAVVEVASYDAELNDSFTAAVEVAAHQVGEHIAQGQRDGRVRRDLEPVMTGRWLAWMTERGMRRAFAKRATAAARDIAAMTDIYWFTLYAGGA